MIRATAIDYSYTDKPLFKSVSFIVGNGQKVGLVGPNGSGKTTLLGLIAGKDSTERGKIEVQGTIALVPQEVKRDPILESAYTVRDYVDPEAIHHDHELLKMFKGLELEVPLDGDPKKLSGGQKTKLALARALFINPDILLLDEPTNFMDTAGKKWVMNFLKNYTKSLVLISHDLKLIDNAIDKVLFVNSHTMGIEEYKGNYSNFLKMKSEKEELLKKTHTVKLKHIKQMEEGLRKMTRFSSAKGVRARVRQQKRIEKEKQLLPELPPQIRSIKISLPTPANVGELPLRTIAVSKSFGELEVLKDFNFYIKRGERVALIGPNGSGKSTFLKILIDLLTADSGEVLRNSELKIGYYSQEFETFDLAKSVIDTFTQTTHKDDGFARSFLGRFMFSGDKVFQRVETLSGGEKTRLAIALLTARDYNLLILDEPTTYLDVISQRVILEALKDYQGAMVVVSHTPEFISELAPMRVYFFPEQKMEYWDESLLDKVSEA